jgi:hypothetical protein
MKTVKDERVKIGEVGVDTGQLMICDLCYIDDEWVKEDYSGEGKPAKHKFSYNAICQALPGKNIAQLLNKMGHPGVGVAFNRGIGDGTYPVYARVVDFGDNRGDTIVEVRIVMVAPPAEVPA